MDYQSQLAKANNEQEAFACFFREFASISGPVCGTAFVVAPDGEPFDVEIKNEEEGVWVNFALCSTYGEKNSDFAKALTMPIVEIVVLSNGLEDGWEKYFLCEAIENQDIFDPKIKKFLPGINVCGLPLFNRNTMGMGVVILYRKGEQPFTKEDVQLLKDLALSLVKTIEPWFILDPPD